MPETDRFRLVAGQQQEGFAQLIHKLISEHLDNLWAICGWARNAVRRGLWCLLTPHTYARKVDARVLILPKVMKPARKS